MKWRKPFKAVPLHKKDGTTIPFRQPRKGTLLFNQTKGNLRFEDSAPSRKEPINWWAIALTFVSVVLLGLGLSMRYGNLQFGSDQPEAVSAAELPVAGPQDTLSATFALCGGGNRSDCVVDGDTFWLAGEKYRVLDINTPETSTPRCDREYELGQAATRRFIELLNAGPFRLESGAEETDRYGRKLRRVMRGQQSLGDVLVAEGLAENWQGFRRDWC